MLLLLAALQCEFRYIVCCDLLCAFKWFYRVDINLFYGNSSTPSLSYLIEGLYTPALQTLQWSFHSDWVAVRYQRTNELTDGRTKCQSQVPIITFRGGKVEKIYNQIPL